jgi:pimeloyl-ACP methyl ester carboxylesterase
MSGSDAATLEAAVGDATAIVSVRPVVLPAPGRGEDLQARVSAPATGCGLPIIVFSHGFGSSMDEYAPLADFWAAHGFAVIQPTHLDSKTLALAPEDPRTPLIWRFRVEDMTRVLDELDLVEASVPGLSGRLDRSHMAVAGHSWGATTASALLGARVLDVDGNLGEEMADPRIKAGVLLCLAGTGGEALAAFAAANFAFMNPSFAQMHLPALMVAGDSDQSMLSVRGPDWWTDGYVQSPGNKSLLTLFGADHLLGGITGPGSPHAATHAVSPGRVALVQQLTTAYLLSALNPQDPAWSKADSIIGVSDERLGRVDSK